MKLGHTMLSIILWSRGLPETTSTVIRNTETLLLYLYYIIFIYIESFHSSQSVPDMKVNNGRSGFGLIVKSNSTNHQ